MDTKGVRQVLDTFYSKRKEEYEKFDLGLIGKDVFKSNCGVVMKEAEQELQEIMLGMLPEEKVGTEKMPLNSVEMGYNIAIQDCKQNIRGGFNNG